VIAKAIEGLLFRWLFIPLARHAPWASRRLRPLFASITWRLLPNRRRTLRETARVLLGSRPSPREIDSHGRRVLLHLQDFIADVATIDRRPIEALASRVKRFDGLDHLLAALRSGRGAILASAHLGSFESAVAALRRASSVPVHVLFARDRIRAFDRARTLARRHLGVVEHPVEGGVDAWLALRDALARGELVAILADRVMPGQRGATISFFERASALPAGPVRLAAISGAPIVPTFMIPGSDGASTLRFEAPIEVDDATRAIDDSHPGQRALVRAMERAIRAAPDQWLVVEGPWIDRADRSGADAPLS